MALADIFSTCWLKVSLLSRVTPRYLSEDIFSRVENLPLGGFVKSVFCASFRRGCGSSKTMNLDVS